MAVEAEAEKAAHRRRTSGRVVPWEVRVTRYVQPYIQHGAGQELGSARDRDGREVTVDGRLWTRAGLTWAVNDRRMESKGVGA